MQASEFQNYSALFAKPDKEDDESNMPKGFEKFLKKTREGRKTAPKTEEKKEEKKAQKKKDEEDDDLSEEEEPEPKKDKKES